MSGIQFSHPLTGKRGAPLHLPRNRCAHSITAPSTAACLLHQRARHAGPSRYMPGEAGGHASARSACSSEKFVRLADAPSAPHDAKRQRLLFEPHGRHMLPGSVHRNDNDWVRTKMLMNPPPSPKTKRRAAPKARGARTPTLGGGRRAPGGAATEVVPPQEHKEGAQANTLF